MPQSDKKKVMEHYNELGERVYDLRYTHEQVEKLKLILNEIDKLGLLLDNGCGTGLLFPQTSNDLVGIDLSYSLLEKAKQRKKENQHLRKVNTILALGKIAFDATLNYYKENYSIKNKEYIFSHGGKFLLPDNKILIGSYHPSPRNVNTGRIDIKKMVSLLNHIKKIVKRK